ncbi:helix-turn-helix domain-containing protein [Streptomyces kanasensis]|uniref:helix-turn-helix domain-containing protein n=1 Tax=Streptomyces kanasensis TaxID=936756 RepID=UPI0036F6E4D8
MGAALSGGYRERPARLDGAVVWTVPGGRPPGAASPVLPDGCMDLLWNEGRLLVAGPDTRAHAPGGGAGPWAGVRFAPGDAPTLLGVPARVLRDRCVDLADLWPADRVRRLTARVARAAGADPAGALEEAAVALAADAPRPDPLLRAVTAGLGAGWSVAATADATGLGPRTLHRRSLDAFGYGPKTLARILRLRRALRLVDAGAPYAAVAVRAGYADQPHLAREVRALTGRPLSAYAASANSSTPRPSGSSTTA